MIDVIKKHKIIFIFSLVIAIALLWIVIPALSEDTTSSAWDGVTISSDFSEGNGTSNNPYIISSPADYAYFKSLMESDEASMYADRYYKLSSSLNFGGYDISIDNEVAFQGHIDGFGEAFYNTTLTKPLFKSMINATIKNIHFLDITITNGAVLATDSRTNNLNEVVLEYNFDSEENVLYGLFETDESSTLTNFIANGTITNSIEGSSSLIGSAKATTFANAYINETTLQMINVSTSVVTSVTTYSNISSLTETQITSLANSLYEIKIEDNKLVLNKIETTNTKVDYFGTITEHETGIDEDDNIVYVNDFQSDYDYYKSLNYTEITSKTTLPTSTNKYSDDNLVQVKIIYDGADINDSTLVGQVSPSETQSKYVYYKYYPLAMSSDGTLATQDGSHYIDIELIDNPFSNRPTKDGVYYGFNGWTCNQTNSSDGICNNTKLMYDDTTYTRTLRVKTVGTASITIHLNASWTSARYFKDTTNALSTNTNVEHFYSESMQNYELTKVTSKTVEIEYDCYYFTSTGSYTLYALEYIAKVAKNDNATLQSYASYGYYYSTSNLSNVNIGNYKTVNKINSSSKAGTTVYVYKVTEVSNGDEYDSNKLYFYLGDSMRSNRFYYFGTQSSYQTSTNATFSSLNTCKKNEVQTETTTTFALKEGDSAVGYYYYMTSYATGTSTSDYYDATGLRCDISGNTCSSAKYKLIQYNDPVTKSDGTSISTITLDDEGKALGEDNYKYLVTRDTNILYLSSGTSYLNNYMSSDYEYTLTGSAYGEKIAAILTVGSSGTGSSSNATVQNDMVIENIKMNSANSERSATYNTSNSIIANYYNLKIGRNITPTSTNGLTSSGFASMNGARDTSSSIKKWKVIIESGMYNSITAGSFSGYSNYGSTNYNFYNTEEKIVYGSDYDRARNDNTKLKVYYQANGSFIGHYMKNTDTATPSVAVTVKSGTYGADATQESQYTYGIYAGGINYGNSDSLRTLTIEGGKIFVINGGPCIYESSTVGNVIKIMVKGGTIDNVVGGAGLAKTYGNRIVSVTGGTINNSVAGGSNSNQGSANAGPLIGDTLVYVGGHAVLGATPSIKGSDGYLFDVVEVGSVFGAGLGTSSASDRGIVRSSHVIINGGTINGSVYGGGNYGTCGGSYTVTTGGGYMPGGGSTTTYSTGSPVTTTIDILDGDLKSSVYGGANLAGFNLYNEDNSTITINLKGGTVTGGVYGGSNGSAITTSSNKAVADANVNINIYGGTYNNIYGGGYGQYTQVARNITVNTPTSTSDISVNNLYGGSALGEVNGSTANDTYKTTITLSRGIYKNVFGGGEGTTSTAPSNYGAIEVNITGANATNVFGANNLNGVPSKSINVNMIDGNVGTIYGGGNKTSVTSTAVTVTGGKTQTVYGGSNQSGTVSKTSIVLNGGTCGNVFGGNNQGGETTETSIDEKTTTILSAIYGGGNIATTATTTINLNNSIDNVVPFVYGGGKNANVTTTTINKNSGTVTNLYGGSNTGGTVATSKINHSSGTTVNLYGGNNQNGVTSSQTIKYTDGKTTNLYGGGNQAKSADTSITVDNGIITNLFGGGNQAGITGDTTTTIKGGLIGNLYGGSNKDGNVDDTTITIGETTTTTSNDIAIAVALSVAENTDETIPSKYIGTATVTIKNNTSNIISDWTGLVYIANSILGTNNSTTKINAKDGLYIFDSENTDGGYHSLVTNGTYSFNFTFYTDVEEFKINSIQGISGISNDTTITSGITIGNLYGGNNLGGTCTNPIIKVNKGTIGSVYGGGNQAEVSKTNVTIEDGTIYTMYGGGNAAKVSGDTKLDINGGTFLDNVYGGGNEGIVEGSTNLTVTDATVTGNIYAGGNGSEAIVKTNTKVLVDGKTVVGSTTSKVPKQGSIFGGGNAAPTGTSDTNNSKAQVYIAGSTVYGNVYGGANTSKVYGSTETYIGSTYDTTLTKNDIYIGGTVFGGGEANESGATDYDFSYISVTKTISVNIDGSDHDKFEIKGSIFGSGDASSSSGTSEINITDYGTYDDPKLNVSIQRTNKLNIVRSAIYLDGALDNTNEFSTTLFSLSRIDELVLKDSSTLFLNNGTNLLEKFTSVDKDDKKATMTKDEETDEVTTNTLNRLYIRAGQVVNIAEDEKVTSYGEVTGMTFFGMFEKTASDVMNTGIYNTEYEQGDSLPATGIFDDMSYVLGLHQTKPEQDIEVDGFYTNYYDSSTETNNIDYIEPTPEDSSFYMWYLGEGVITYNIDLEASKYSTLGSTELTFIDFSHENTSFQLQGFDSTGLENGIELIDRDSINKIETDTSRVNSKFGLVMESSNKGWLTNGKTSFLGTNEIDSGTYTGTKYYSGDSSTLAPSMLFTLYHSKNITLTQDLGTVRVLILAIRQKDALTKEATRIVVNVHMTTNLYQEITYEGAITPGDKYELFTSTQTNITDSSKMSGYFALYAEKTDLYKEGYKHTLISSIAFPAGTKITMIDHNNGNEKYYYYNVTEADQATKIAEVTRLEHASYDLSLFTEMGTTDGLSKYNDATMNSQYIYEGYTHEEFNFIIDFKNADFDSYLTASGLTEADLHNNCSLLFELRNSEDETKYSVLGTQQENTMFYNIYRNSDATISVSSTLEENPLYVGKKTELDVAVNYAYQMVGSNIIYDTTYFDNKLGLEIYIKHKDGSVLTSTELTGMYIELNNTKYYPTLDGSIRIPAAEKIGKSKIWLYINLEKGNMPTDDYIMEIKAFGSPDGLYYGDKTSEIETTSLQIINSSYGLDATINDESVIINNDGKNQDGDKKFNVTIDYSAAVTNPNLHIKMYRRSYSGIYDTKYNEVNASSFFDVTTPSTTDSKEYIVMSSITEEQSTLTLDTKDSLQPGTYKIDFILYDGNSEIGSISKYMIVY